MNLESVNIVVMYSKLQRIIKTNLLFIVLPLGKVEPTLLLLVYGNILPLYTCHPLKPSIIVVLEFNMTFYSILKTIYCYNN